MGGSTRRLYALLRSRKLAFWLIAAFIAYCAVAVSLADGDWSRAFANPLFVAISGALAAATAACAGERTAGALKAWRGGTRTAPGFAERLARNPQIRVAVAPGIEAGEALRRAAEALRARGLRVEGSDTRIAATSRGIALAGSPVFHWSLVALFVLVAAGQLTRSEGLMGVAVGSRRAEVAGAYGVLDAGPLHPSGPSGRSLGVAGLELGHVAGGVDRGAAPLVELYDGDTLVARQLVYPNNPLRHGALMVHSNAYGLAARFILDDGTGAEAVDVLCDFDPEAPVAVSAGPLVFERSGAEVEFVVSVPLDSAGGQALWEVPARPRADWTLRGADDASSGTLVPGGSIDLGDGASLRFEDLGYYARLSVVDDWSVYPIYAALVTGVLALALALLLPPKAVWVMLVAADGGIALHARTRQARADALFASHVEQVLREAAGEGDDRP